MEVWARDGPAVLLAIVHNAALPPEGLCLSSRRRCVATALAEWFDLCGRAIALCNMVSRFVFQKFGLY